MRNNTGFTLIEVLIALAIIGIALTAVIKVTVQNVRDTHYLQQKVIATWVATRIVNEARGGLINVSKSDEITDDTDMLAQSWTWKATLEGTANPHIQSIHVSVYPKNSADEITHLTSYLYAQR